MSKIEVHNNCLKSRNNLQTQIMNTTSCKYSINDEVPTKY